MQLMNANKAVKMLKDEFFFLKKKWKGLAEIRKLMGKLRKQEAKELCACMCLCVFDCVWPTVEGFRCTSL